MMMLVLSRTLVPSFKEQSALMKGKVFNRPRKTRVRYMLLMCVGKEAKLIKGEVEVAYIQYCLRCNRSARLDQRILR